MDANEYALKVGPATKSLGIVIRSAQWLGQGARRPITTTAATSAESAMPTITTQGVVSSPMRGEVASVPPSPLVVEEAAKKDQH
jgi:DNA primase